MLEYDRIDISEAIDLNKSDNMTFVITGIF